MKGVLKITWNTLSTGSTVTITGTNCEYFNSTDIYDTVGKLPVGGIFSAVSISNERDATYGYYWIQITRNGTTYYVVYLKDRMTLDTITLVKYQMKGLDVSKWQYNINFAAVKADGYDFVFIRAVSTDSSGLYKDPYFEQNYANAVAAGLYVGAYYYTYALDTAYADRELTLFKQCLAGKHFNFPVAVDMEESTVAETGNATALLKYALDNLLASGYYPMQYTYLNFAKNYLNREALSQYDMWMAQYADACTYTGPYTIWQYTSSATIAGVSGGADADICYYDYANYIVNCGWNGYTRVAPKTLYDPDSGTGGNGGTTDPEVPVPDDGIILEWRQRQMRGKEAALDKSSLILGDGEIAFLLDENNKTVAMKVGDGRHTWSQLDFFYDKREGYLSINA